MHARGFCNYGEIKKKTKKQILIATEIRAVQLGSLLGRTEMNWRSKNISSDRQHRIQNSYLVQERVKDLARQLTVAVIKLNGAMLL